MTMFQGKHGPWLVAEIGGNHEGDFEYALRLTELAIGSGVDAVKFQLYYGDTLVSSVESPDRHSHFRRFELTPQQHLALAGKVRAAGLHYVASVWDDKAIAWIDPVISAYKIGSGDVTAVPLLRAIAATGRPIIVSTGLCNSEEVTWVVEYIRSCNARYLDRQMLALLQCTSMYPIGDADAHLAVMESFQSLNVAVGYSDHTPGLHALDVAAAMGAEVLEFHFTDSKKGRIFRDHQLSLEQDDVRRLIERLELIKTLRGSPQKRPAQIELECGHVQSFRRAVYPSRDIAAGEVLDDENLCVLRPNHGLDAREYERLVGRRARRALPRHAALTWDDID